MASLFDRVDRRIVEFKQNWVRNVQDKQKRWWMEIILSNDVCVEPSEEMKKVGSNDVDPHVLIQITWDNVIKYGKYAVHKVRKFGTYSDDLLRKDMHEVRKAIANALQKLCKSECVWEMVGSDSNVSDVDINVFDDRVDLIKPLIQKHLSSWVGGNHVDTLFDMNIYLSAFGRKEAASRNKAKNRRKNPYIEKIPFSKDVNYVFIAPNATPEYEESQLTWGLLHLFDESLDSLNEKEVDLYIENSIWAQSWRKAKELRIILERNRGNSEKTIVALVKEAQNLWQQIATDTSVTEDVVERYMNVLSTIQYYSRETYLTRGAYFHVVMELSNRVPNLNLQTFEYMHSVIDNLAFIAEQCKRDTLCPVQYSTIFAKISKYVYRICDAMVKVGITKHSVWDILAIRDSAATLNTLRKKAPVEPSVLLKQMKELHTLLDIASIYQGDDGYTNSDLATVFAKCMQMALAPFNRKNSPRSRSSRHTKTIKTSHTAPSSMRRTVRLSRVQNSSK